MSNSASSEAAKAVVRRNTEVQGKGNFDVFEELFADDFVDHTPQPTMIPDKHGARGLYRALREAFPDFYAVFHWQTADGEIMTTFKRRRASSKNPRRRRRRGRPRHSRYHVAKVPYTTLQHAVHIHPTVSELIPTILAELKPRP
jgi:SnoaL-like domain